MSFLSHQSMTLYGTPLYAIASLYFNTLFYPTNLWPSTVLFFMLLHIPQSMTLYGTWSCRKRRKCTKWWNPWPIYDPLRYIPFSLATIAQWYRNMSKLVWTCLVSSETVFRWLCPVEDRKSGQAGQVGFLGPGRIQRHPPCASTTSRIKVTTSPCFHLY